MSNMVEKEQALESSGVSTIAQESDNLTPQKSPDPEAVVEIPASSETIEHQESPRKGISEWRWYVSFFGLWISALLYGLDTTIAADVQGPIYEALGDIKNLPWIGLGFPMASVAVILFLGRSFALFDLKWLTTTSIAIFEVGSAVCGAAPSSNALIIGRVIAGIGGAGMYLGALNYVSAFTTPKEASLYNAMIGFGWGIGAILGPVIGGAFSVSSATWRWVNIFSWV
jgi:MFS family permease